MGADGRSTYRVKLHGLPADYDVELYNEEGRKVAAPQRRGKRTEEISQVPAAGRYYVRVVGYQEAWSTRLPYQLKFDSLGAGQRAGDDD